MCWGHKSDSSLPSSVCTPSSWDVPVGCSWLKRPLVIPAHLGWRSERPAKLGPLAAKAKKCWVGEGKGRDMEVSDLWTWVTDFWWALDNMVIHFVFWIHSPLIIGTTGPNFFRNFSPQSVSMAPQFVWRKWLQSALLIEAVHLCFTSDGGGYI